MTRLEIMRACLSERQAQQNELQKQIEHLNAECEKLDFEEDMYFHLKENSSHYRDVYTNKQEESSKKLDEVETKKEEIDKDLKILQRENDYISNRLR